MIPLHEIGQHLLRIAFSWLVKQVPDAVKKFLPKWPHKKPLFTDVHVSYVYSQFRGQNHVRKGGRKKFCHTSLSFTILNRSGSIFVLQDLTLWVSIGTKMHRFNLFDEELNKWGVQYNLEGHKIYTFSYRCVPAGFAAWLGYEDGTLPFSSKDEIEFYCTYQTERGHTERIEVGSVQRLRFNPALIAS